MRIVFKDLVIGNSYTVKIDYDTTIGDKHAYDYLGTYTSSQTLAEGNDPCAGVAGCALGDLDNDTAPIPIDPNVTGAGVTQIGGQVFTCFNCDITAVSAYTLTGSYASGSNTSLIVTFTAKAANPVLAFAGHVASRLDWGPGFSAVDVSGSPYHWAVNDGPNRQMKVEAKGFPAKLKIVKVVGTPNSTSEIIFGFDRSDVAGSPNFFLQDNNNNADGNPDSITIDYPIAAGGSASVSITELPSFVGWGVTDIACVDADGGLGSTANSTPQSGFYVSGSTAVANMSEAEFVTCTFTNGITTSTAAPASVGGEVISAFGRPLQGITVTLTDLASGETRSTRTDLYGKYLFTDVEITKFYSLSVKGKRNSFPDSTKYFTLDQDMFDMNFTAAD